jgi:MFS family permease
MSSGAILEATLPSHMMIIWASPTWLQGRICTIFKYFILIFIGMAFLPFSIAMFLSLNIFGRLAFRMGRWLCALSGMLVIAVGLISVRHSDCILKIIYINSKQIPHAPVFYVLIIPVFITGAGIGMVSAAMVGGLTEIVVDRYASGFGNVFSIFDMTLCLSFILGNKKRIVQFLLMYFDYLF